MTPLLGIESVLLAALIVAAFDPPGHFFFEVRFRVSQLVDPALHRERGESQRCAFCNYRGKLTSEHIWPERFQTLFPELKMVKVQHGDPRSPLEFDAMAFTGKVRIDCDRCNNIKLETIERAAMPHIKFLALAIHAGVLPFDAQRKLAAFGVRMLAVGQYTHTQLRPIPRHHREHLVLNRSPHQHTEVSLWAYYGPNFQAPQVRGIPQKVMLPGERSPDWINAYRGIVRIGHLVIEVAGRTDGRPVVFLPKPPGTFVRIWPIDLRGPQVWAPNKSMTEVGWEQRVADLDRAITL